MILGNTTLYIKNDTVIYVPDTAQITTRTSPKTQAFYDFLKTEFYKNKITKELYNLLFAAPASDNSQTLGDQNTLQQSEEIFMPYDGKIIRKIKLTKLEVFGPTLEDTARSSKAWATRTANKLHIDTQDRVIFNNMLFKEGDYIDPLLLADNERVIRQLPFIRDARIIVVPSIDDPDIVDLIIITQDVWSISGDFTPRGFNAAALSIDDRNILGLGHELLNRVFFDHRLKQNFGYEGSYRIPNMSGTFVTGEISFANTYFKDGFSFRLFRDFITPEMRYAGGLELSNIKYLAGISFLDTAIIFPVKAGVQDLWLGKAFPTGSSRESQRERSRIVAAARVKRTNFTLRPLVSADTNQSYHSNTTLLATIGLSTRKYYKDRLIYGYGRTEDIPYGNLIEITTGVSLGEFYDRPYLGIRWARGGLVRNYGYTYLGVSAGSFIRNQILEQGVLKLETNFFSNLIGFRKHRVRQFLELQYTLGIRRFADEFINIRDENGIRGLRNDFFLRGQRKIVLSFETVDFTPLDIIGFRVAIFGFADIAKIASNNEPLFKGQLFQGYGLGVRLNNDLLTFNTFQLRLAYYPNVPPGLANFGFNAGGITQLRLDDFDIRAPNTNLFD
ncbi:MAG: hypothetical protein M3512_02370 [Bacteroidota bacterium]|nr:hypothetical protein [Bacteroidota bacterium]